MNTAWIIVIIALGLLVAALAVFGGHLVNRILPREPLQVGDQVEIFLDGVYNRTATITGCTGDRLYIYDTLPLPLGYRGKFYATGFDIDGVEFWYLRERKRYNLVPFAESVRKRYKLLSDPFNLCPVTTEEDLLTAAARQKAEAEEFAKQQGANSAGEGAAQSAEEESPKEEEPEQ